ncbi:MAG: Cys-tRNA(Pro) deacylase [Deltaproteobacteria bacterium]|nr:Cys-tRNA(Pro) deacylase [Deltaproteobacteria bacterium]
MAKDKTPVTPAVRFLREAGVAFLPHAYAYEEKGGTRVAARELGVEEHRVIKTLIMADEHGAPLVVLMHGDREVSTKTLARTLGVRSVHPVDPKEALRLTGYQVGGISPFGTRQKLPVYVEKTILDLPRLIINGGRRGLLLELDPAELVRTLAPVPVEAARESEV